jgi:hypothetical protein
MTQIHIVHPIVATIVDVIVGVEDAARQEKDEASYGDAMEVDIGPDKHQRTRPLPPALPVIIVTGEAKHMTHLLQGRGEQVSMCNYAEHLVMPSGGVPPDHIIGSGGPC